MPTTRRQSAGPSTPSATLSATPKPSSSRSARRSLSHTPSGPQSGHAHTHRTADEIMLDEAEQILHPHQQSPQASSSTSASGSTPQPHITHRRQTAAQLAAAEANSIMGDDASLASPALRSGRLRGENRRESRGSPASVVVEIPVSASQSRGQTKRSGGRMSIGTKADESEEEEETLDENETSAMLSQGDAESLFGPAETAMEESQGLGILGLHSTDGEPEEAEDGEEETVEMRADQKTESESSHTTGKDDVSFTSSTTAQPSSALPTGSSSHIAASQPAVASASSPIIIPSDEADESSSSEEDSDSDSDSSTSETSDEDSDEDEDEAAEDERLERLLAAAKLSAKNASAGSSSGAAMEAQDVGMGEEDMLRLDADEDVADTPIPQMIISGLPPSSLHFGNSGTPQAGPSRPTQKRPESKTDKVSSGKERAIELDNREYERPLTKREKANQPKKATPSELWSTLPSARADMLPQMKRDYQALALANSMDPKRFMKGGSKAGRVPETFAIGTIVEQPRHLQATTMTRETKYRPGQLVQDVIEDTGVGEYAKRKFGDLQWKRMENGRGKGWKKKAKW